MTKVQLVTTTERPIETLLCLWEASRSDYTDVPTVWQWKEILNDDKHPRHAEAWSTFDLILDAGIPVLENVSLTYLLSDVSIELREQMVRHRIGQKHGDRLGLDFVPDLASSTWWSQSMRVLDMGKFATNGRYRVPESIKTDVSERRYRAFMHAAEDLYNTLVADGVPREDARAVLPLACTHRISWTLNLAALKHVVGKRSCWILQLGLWKPVVLGMVDELCSHVSTRFRRLVAPPCFKGDRYVGCNVVLDNVKRLRGEDPLPPCQLFLSMQEDDALPQTIGGQWNVKPDCCENKNVWVHPNKNKQRLLRRMSQEYAKLWGRNLETGERQ